jgi:hypothetical protein
MEEARSARFDLPVHVTDEGDIGGGGGELNDPYRAPGWKNTLNGAAADGPLCLKTAKELDEEIYYMQLALKDQKDMTAAAHKDFKNAKSSTQYYMPHVVGGDGGHEEHELAIQGHEEAEGNHSDEPGRPADVHPREAAAAGENASALQC